MTDRELPQLCRQRAAELKRLRAVVSAGDTDGYRAGLIAQLEAELDRLTPALREALNRVQPVSVRPMLYDYYALAMTEAELCARYDRSARWLRRLRADALEQLTLSR